jgi:hypothetical protein
MLSLAPTAFSQQSTPATPTIRVMASAVISAKPDHAEIDIGVVTQAQQPGDAAAENAKKVSSVLAALRKAADKAADVQTVSYTLTPTYRYPTGEEPVLVGYTASNTVRVALDDLERLGMVADAAIHAGANRILDMRFTLRDPQGVRLEALRQAALKAHGEADALASALGVRVSRILSVDEGNSAPVPVRHIMLATKRMRADDATPIEGGTLGVRADVTLTVEVGQKRAESP